MQGRLRIYLGAAPGVGKTVAMLDEGRRRRDRGTDVVAAFVETHGRTFTATCVGELEVVPRRRVEYRGHEFEEMDLEATIARRPQVALVDEYAHTNIPGSGAHEKRWQDVEALLDAGIDVISTLNIQHLDSLNDVIERITGVVQHETIPDATVRRADQIEFVDMTPEALQRRMAHGNIYPAERIDPALGNYFRIGNLAALRELALHWVADRADEQLSRYRAAHGITEPWETRERVVVAVTGSPGGERLLRRGARMASRMQGDLVAVHVEIQDGFARRDPVTLDDTKELTAALGGRFVQVAAPDVAEALVDLARSENATQLVLGATHQGRWADMVRGSVINAVIRAADDIDVHVISTPAVRGKPLPRRRPAIPRSRRRRQLSWLLAVVLMPLLALALVPLRGSNEGFAGALLVLLLGTLVISLVGGIRPAFIATAVALALGDFYYTQPLHSFRMNRTSDVVILFVFVAVAVIGSVLTDRLTRRSFEVARSRGEAELLARLAAASVLPGAEALVELVNQLRVAFELDAVAVLSPTPAGWHTEAAAGDVVLRSPVGSQHVEQLSGGSVLVVAGQSLSSDDRRLLAAFAAQLRVAQERIRLQGEANEAEVLADANNLRTAILAAVSHDLRTPLASIKAAATSILSSEVNWSEEAIRIFSETIDEEADRLNLLVGNLLNMSRLQTGSLHPSLRPVGLEEVTFAAVTSLSRDTKTLNIDVSEHLPRVQADATLLERAIANLIDNAINWSPDEEAVRIVAGEVASHVDLRVVDRGPGIPAAQREAVFRPFQRLDDGRTAHTNGVGLGLAVARGFVEAMGGELRLEDTPGGGATMVVSLPTAT